jgi:hypothetical protein
MGFMIVRIKSGFPLTYLEWRLAFFGDRTDFFKSCMSLDLKLLKVALMVVAAKVVARIASSITEWLKCVSCNLYVVLCATFPEHCKQ